MVKRRALLMGVPEYESDKLNNLEIVYQDIELLHSSLEKSGFSVIYIGTDGEKPSTQNKIKQAIRKECREIKKADVLLLYFSGHGIHYKGKDYLVPYDADLEDGECIEDYLIATDLAEFVDLDRCDAKTIIFFIDACREGIKLDFKALSLSSFGRGDRQQASKRRCILIFSCESGQYSQYVNSNENHNGFSLFSKALAEVLDPQFPASTLKEVLEATQIKLNKLVTQYGKKEQKIHYSCESSVEDDPLLRVICEGTIQEEKQQEENAWIKAVRQSPLWEGKEENEHKNINSLKQEVERIVLICWQKWQDSIKTLPNDKWRDFQFPLRMLEALNLLIFKSEKTINLSDAEKALIIIIPFIREAILANGVIEIAQTKPLSLEKKGAQIGLGNGLDKLHQSQPRFIRKAKRLEEQEKFEDKDAVMAWLMHHCLLKTIEIWLPQSKGGYLADDFLKELGNNNNCQSRLVKETLEIKRLIELARCTLVDIERIDRDDRRDSLEEKITVGSYHEEEEIREKMLAYLLKLASLLAIDVRTLSDVLVDHIGLSDPIHPQDVLKTLNEVRWNPLGKGRSLKVICYHPAVDLALKNHVKGTDEILGYILRQVTVKGKTMEALAGLPTHLLPDGIVAEKRDGIPLYQTPHVNFQLAHDEIRELLMGEQLYGDPTLAIRELYQNALDACRYREARIKYLQQTNNYRGKIWEGKIIFRQEKDEKGREYIECEDNGIGMGVQHISQCFARAGRRFADLPEFIEEQAEWLKCEPPIRLYPNSQFGIGVLSYFMLADEIEVETCRLDQFGQPERQLQVRIPGSSGLFRVQELGEGKDSGTKIRLYLNRTHYQNEVISCLAILRKLLWVADFETEVREFDKQEIWLAGRLKHPELAEDCYINANHPDLWWITEKGCILSDGLVTEETHPCVVINLCRSHRPKLTVDRKKIVEWDQDWAGMELSKGGESLVNWPALSLDWLWELEKSEVHLAEIIVDFLIEQDITITIKRLRNQENDKISLAKFGCFFPDYNSHNLSLYSRINRNFTDYRSGLLKSLLSQDKNNNDHHTLRFKKYQSLPVPIPGDAIAFLLDTDLLDTEWTENQQPFTEITYPFPYQVVKAASILDESVEKILKRLQKLIGFGIKIPKVDADFFSDCLVNANDVTLLPELQDTNNYRLKSGLLIGSLVFLTLHFKHLNWSIAEVYQRLQRFSCLGLKLPKIDRETLNNLSFIEEDLIILSQSLNKKRPWINNKVPIIDILKISQKLNISLGSTLAKLQKFIPLGLELPQVKAELLEEVYIPEKILEFFTNFTNFTKRNKRKFIAANSDDEITMIDILLNIDRKKVDQAEFETEDSFKEWLSIEINQIMTIINSLIPLGVTLQEYNSIVIDSLTQKDIKRLYIYVRGLFEFLKVNDYSLITYIVEVSYRFQEPVKETLDSLQKFSQLGLNLPAIYPNSLEDFTVDFSDLNYFYRFFQERGNRYSDYENFVELLEYLKSNNISSAELKQKKDNYALLGLEIPVTILENLDEITTMDILTLYPNLENKHSLSQIRQLSNLSNFFTIHILCTAYWNKEPLCQTLARFKKLLPVGIAGIKLPENIPNSLNDYRISIDDLTLISNNFNVQDNSRRISGDWPEKEILPLHILQATVKFNKTVTEIVEQLQRFEPLGLEIPQIPIETLTNLTPTQEDMLIFSKNLDGNAPFFKETIPNYHIIQASFELNESLADTLKRVQRFAPLNLDIPSINPEELGEFKVNYDDLILLSQDLDAHEPWLEDEISINHILRVSMWLKKPVASLLRRIEKLRLLGFKIPETNPDLWDNLIVSQADLIVLSEDLDGDSPWLKGEVSDFHIRCASERLNESIETTLSRLEKYSLILNNTVRANFYQ